ncbi:hypothetical protein [Asticcacaulis sp. MM231]|uniref:hypothetical protein n=1 Tax=Asticcacaulis sp. MM231 TaxID=3157666 RepID=UPI0032D57B8C
MFLFIIDFYFRGMRAERCVKPDLSIARAAACLSAIFDTNCVVCVEDGTQAQANDKTQRERTVA